MKTKEPEERTVQCVLGSPSFHPVEAFIYEEKDVAIRLRVDKKVGVAFELVETHKFPKLYVNSTYDTLEEAVDALNWYKGYKPEES